MARAEWDINSQEVYAADCEARDYYAANPEPRDETDTERADRIRDERLAEYAAAIQVRPDSNCIAGWEYLAFVPGFEEEGWDHHGPTPEAARESLIDYLEVVA